MKILYVISGLGSGGKERQLLELAKAIKENRNDFELYLLILKNEVDYDVVFKEVKNVTVINRKKLSIFSLVEIIKSFLYIKPDIVHAWDDISVIFLMIPVLFTNCIFLNGSIRGSKEWNKRKMIIKLTSWRTSFIIANSKAGLKSINKDEDAKYKVIYNGFDINRVNNLLDPDMIKKRHELNGKIIVGMVANIRPAKDYLTFIRAAEAILRERSEYIFLSIGEGILINELKTITDRYKKNIIFLGKIKDVESYINIFDIGVLLTNPRVASEGISNAIMEYMALKKPVIASACGGNGEIVVDGETGYLIEPFHINELINKLSILSNDKQKRNLMGQKGYSRLCQNFNIAHMKKNYLELYKKSYGF